MAPNGMQRLPLNILENSQRVSMRIFRIEHQDIVVGARFPVTYFVVELGAEVGIRTAALPTGDLVGAQFPL